MTGNEKLYHDRFSFNRRHKSLPAGCRPLTPPGSGNGEDCSTEFHDHPVEMLNAASPWVRSGQCWNCKKEKFFTNTIWNRLVGQNIPKMDSDFLSSDGAECDSRNCHTCHVQYGPFAHDTGQIVDNSASLLHRLVNLYGNRDLSDIQITVGLQVYHAHKLVLCSASDVFQVMLMNPSWPESQRNNILLKEEPECIQVFDIFLQYLYTGAIHLTHLNVLPVLMLADKYHVCELQAVCVNYMCSHVVSTLEFNHAVSWLQYANLCCHRTLAQCCHNFILHNFQKVISTKDFLLMEKEVLLDFLHSSDLVIGNEHMLYKGISRWLTTQQQLHTTDISEFQNTILELLSQIRFPMMLPLQLCELEHDPFAGIYRNFFIEKISSALKYHSVIETDREEFASMSNLSDQFHPRNYTNDMWSTSLAIDNFTSLPEYDVRPVLFSSPVSGSEADENQSWEWNMDVFAKGVHFEKCIMIGLWRNLEISGAVYNTVRLLLENRSGEPRNVNISVLVTGVQDNVEYVKTVVEKRCSFDHENKVCLLDNVVPYELLNCDNGRHSPYLSGADGDSFKISIIIKPV